MEKRILYPIIILLCLFQAGCRYWLGPNKVNLHCLPQLRNALVDGGYRGGRLSANWAPEYETIHFTHLQRNTTYSFWISMPVQSWQDPKFLLNHGAKIDDFKILEIKLLDENGNVLKYNDDFTAMPTNNYDTLAFFRYRTPGQPEFEEVYLRISTCVGPVRDLNDAFQIHVEAHRSPKRYRDNYPVDETAPEAARAEVDHLRVHNPITVQLNGGSDHPRHGHAYCVWKEWCAIRTETLDDRLECTLHNFKAYWFRPPISGTYSVVCTSDKEELPESLAVSVFHDARFRIPLGTSLDDADVMIKRRGVAICDDIGTGVRMIGAGKRGHAETNKITIGEADNNLQGIAMMRDSVYYVLVSAPIDQTPKCKIEITQNNTKCLYPASNSTIGYAFPCSLVTRLGDSYMGISQREQAGMEPWEMNRVGMESQWSKYCWFEIAGSEARAYRFEVKANFEGKISIFEFGDPADLTTYGHLYSRLFGFGAPNEVIKFNLTGDQLKRRLRVIVSGKPCVENDSIFINLIPINIPIGGEG